MMEARQEVAKRRRPGAAPTEPPTNIAPRRTWLLLAVLLLLNYFLMRHFFPGPDAPVTVPYTAFKQEVEKGNVNAIYSQGARIEGRFVRPVTWPQGAPATKDGPPAAAAGPARTSQTFTTTLPTFVDPGLEQFLIDNEVEISAVPIQAGNVLATLVYGFGPALLLIGFYIWLYRRAAQGGAGGALFGMGKSLARR